MVPVWVVTRAYCRGLLAWPDIEVAGKAADGLEAIAKAEQLQPTVILMDAQMPNMDGVEATRRIKKRFPNIKILFLTVHTAYTGAALAAGADGYLLKDCSRQELLQEIRDLGRQGAQDHRQTNLTPPNCTQRPSRSCNTEED